jgi:CspA family cold shock protein
MAVIVEDLIRLLDSIGEGYRHGRHPDGKKGKSEAQVLRAVATELEL